MQRRGSRKYDQALKAFNRQNSQVDNFIYLPDPAEDKIRIYAFHDMLKINHAFILSPSTGLLNQYSLTVDGVLITNAKKKNGLYSLTDTAVLLRKSFPSIGRFG